MKKDIELNIALFKNGTVDLDDDSFKGETYESGTVEFTGTVDGRRKTFNPMETMEKAGLVTTNHDGNMFPTYKATSKLYKAFTSTGLVLSFADNISTRERLDNLVVETGVTQWQAFTNLKNAGIIAVSDAYQLSDEKLKAIILK